MKSEVNHPLLQCCVPATRVVFRQGRKAEGIHTRRGSFATQHFSLCCSVNVPRYASRGNSHLAHRSKTVVVSHEGCPLEPTKTGRLDSVRIAYRHAGRRTCMVRISRRADVWCLVVVPPLSALKCVCGMRPDSVQAIRYGCFRDQLHRCSVHVMPHNCAPVVYSCGVPGSVT
jgi:hypothetical protein